MEPARRWVISNQPVHQALVSEADYIAAQDVCAAPGPAPRAEVSSPERRRYLLAGIIVCGTCGRRMESAWSNGKPAYRCRHGHTTASPSDPGQAKNAYVREDRIAVRLVPLTVGGLIYTSSMVMLDCARRKAPVPALARWLLGLGITATLAANVAHGLGHGPTGAVVAAWPAVALVGSCELLMMIIRSAQLPGAGTALGGAPECVPDADPLQAQAAQAFAVELAAGRVPSVRAIRARLHVGQPRAQRVRAYLAALNDAQAGASLEHPAAISEVRSAA